MNGFWEGFFGADAGVEKVAPKNSGSGNYMDKDEERAHGNDKYEGGFEEKSRARLVDSFERAVTQNLSVTGAETIFKNTGANKNFKGKGVR